MMNDYIHQFPEQIQKRIDAGRRCDSSIGKGWLPLVVELDARLSQTDPDYVIDQIKEKFGGLRYYVGTISQEGYSLIDEAETQSLSVCEMCGGRGKSVVSGRGWKHTRCSRHKLDQ